MNERPNETPCRVTWDRDNSRMNLVALLWEKATRYDMRVCICRFKDDEDDEWFTIHRPPQRGRAEWVDKIREYI